MANPVDVQANFGGKKWWLMPLHETDRDRAYIKSIPIIAEWKARISAARAQQIDPIQYTIGRLTAEYAKLKAPLDPAGVAFVREVVAFVFQQVGGIAAIEQHTLLSTMRGDVMAALVSVPNSERATDAMRQITAGETATPYGKYLDRWIASLRKSKTTAQYERNVRAYAATVPKPIERLSGPDVQSWIEYSLKAELAAPTMRYKLAANRAYWTWMQANGLAPIDRHPFRDRLVKDPQTAVERAENARTRFVPHDVPSLWQEADRYGDFDLYAAIQLSAHMGWRLEEVCRLRVENIRIDREYGVRCIRGGLKSQAGVRDMPIPDPIDDLVMRLAGRQDADGYLIRSTSNNQWKLRGGGTGQRFTRLKRRLGFDGTRTFHSIRHSYAHMLSKARVPMHNNIKDLMGHKGKSVTEGYIGETPLDEKLHWLSLAMHYPDAREGKSR
jgi:integrase